ncbi:MAG TPA: hypothetical protein VN780_03000 [Candidatus Eisenbacteria bacterium]|jgi:uncharacterized protein YoxC|nr:hypothetical protein [Candidatus Eisenbacteria bacterium]
MQTWVAVFVVVAAIAIVIQVALLSALFFQMRRTMERLDAFTTDLQSRVGPILTRVQLLLDDTQPKISELVADAAHVVYLTRSQAQKMDRVFTEASDRLRGQLVTVDRIVGAALETVEDAGSQFRRSVWKPMQKASAIITGIKVGLDLLRSRRGNTSAASRRDRDDSVEHEEELFI